MCSEFAESKNFLVDCSNVDVFFCRLCIERDRQTDSSCMLAVLVFITCHSKKNSIWNFTTKITKISHSSLYFHFPIQLNAYIAETEKKQVNKIHTLHSECPDTIWLYWDKVNVTCHKYSVCMNLSVPTKFDWDNFANSRHRKNNEFVNQSMD